MKAIFDKHCIRQTKTVTVLDIFSKVINVSIFVCTQHTCMLVVLLSHTNMNSIIIISMLLAVCFASADARIRAGLFRHPQHPGKCHLGEGLIMETGEVSKKHDGECKMVTCYENGHASIMHCVKQKMREGCTEGHVLYPEAAFPDCCKREISCSTFYYSPTF
ncbi:uncharacterized protein LOC129911696 isoform X2 [Episyrphus balteatus]|uniref:uncharacterized protein LOC129911696 isoform X2 n=1 Tax=Episyrphus balteatus TaxID=286459 RepID=UPI002485B921|nr:uncharacterized protein LOC129911696 isoform X2 [Episyrphus balteatus]